MVEIGVDESIGVLTIAEHFALCDPAAPSLTFAIAKFFFGALCNTSAIIGLS